ncbi:MAG: hypothetical protein ACKV22_25370 [Bryobacteraceae bacterium]
MQGGKPVYAASRVLALDWTITVYPVAEILTPPALPSGKVGTSDEQTLRINGGDQPYLWSLVGGSIPPGVIWRSDGVLSGTPTFPGVYRARMKANGSFVPAAQAERTFDLYVEPATPPRDCTAFPANFRPFRLLYYVLKGTGASADAGYLAVGALTETFADTLRAIGTLPLPATPNQAYCEPVELSPGFWATPYVPTSEERSGRFPAFANVFYDPFTYAGGPFPHGMFQFPAGTIPASRIGGTYAWRLASVNPPSISLINGVVDAASYTEGVVKGSWMTIQGTNLATATRTWTARDFTGNQLPTSIANNVVEIGAQRAPLLYVSPGQINLQMPEGEGFLGLPTFHGASPTYAFPVAASNPSFFLLAPDNGKFAAAVHTDGMIVGRPDLFQGAARTRPAKPGDTILIFGSGFGPTNPPVLPGQVFTGAAALAGEVQIAIGGKPAAVAFAGLSGAGLYQFNVTIPEIPDGDQLLTATLNGRSSQANVYMTIQR